MRFRLRDVSAVDGETSSGDESCFFRREISDQAGHVRYVAHPLQGNERLNQGDASGIHVGGCGTGLDIVDCNGAWCEIDRGAANKSCKRRLRHRIYACSWKGGSDSRVASDRDDAATVLHVPRSGLDTNEGGPHVDRQHLVEVLKREKDGRGGVLLENIVVWEVIQ